MPRPHSMPYLRRAREARHRARIRAAGSLAALGEALRLGTLVPLDYPPSRAPGPRYGHGRPPHPGLAEIVESGRAAYAASLDVLLRYAGDLRAIPLAAAEAGEPAWDNGFLPGLDSAALYAFARARAPRRYVEIGSGNSTAFVARARNDGHLPTHITSIDPHPRRDVANLCDTAVRAGLEQADLGVFAGLEAGDMVFADGSHRVFEGSDATVFFLEVLPALPTGVLVGVHDVYLPDGYPPTVTDRHYSEQYLLAAWLLAAPGSLRPVLAASFAGRDPALRARVDALWRRVGVAGIEPHGVAFWFET